MVRLRLQRTGRKNYAKWRVVATDRHQARDARCIEILGWYDPHRKEPAPVYKLDLERAEHWVSKGAMPSDAVRRMINEERRKKAAPVAAPAGDVAN